MQFSTKHLIVLLVVIAFAVSSYVAHKKLADANLKIEELRKERKKLGFFFIDQMLGDARGTDPEKWEPAIMQRLKEDDSLNDWITHFSYPPVLDEESGYLVFSIPCQPISSSRSSWECYEVEDFSFYFKNGKCEKFKRTALTPW